MTIAPDDALRLVLCNAPEAAAVQIADALVVAGLAACVNLVGPVRSVYVWEGAVQHDTETTLLIKTTAGAVEAVTARIVALHPYTLPEVVALPIAAGEGHAPYLAWVAAQVRRTA